VRLGDWVTKIGSGITPLGGQASYPRSGIPLIRSQNVHLNRFVPEGLAYISPEQDAEMEGTRVCPGDVLLNITGASIGRVCVVPESLCPANVNQHVSIIRCKSEINSGFLSFYISTPEFQRFIMDSQAGATRQALTKVLIEDFRIPLPPLQEQKRIAAILNEQMAAVERARASAEAQLEAAKALPAAYLRAVFSSREARNWPILPIGTLGDAQRGDAVQTGPFGAQLPSSEFTRAGVPVLNIGNVQWGYLDLSRLDHVTPEKAAALDRYLVREGDLLFTRSGTIGRCCIVPTRCDGWLISYHLLRVAFDHDRVCPDFALAALRGFAGVKAQLRLVSGRGATRDGVNSTILSELRIPSPHLSEQRRIAALLNEQIASADRTHQAIAEQLDAINKLPGALLRRAFNGEV
jgi:type I restriction enzyme S subunit